MKSTVETVSPTQVRLEIEVPFDELGPSIDKAYKSIGSQVNIPGFRKGKVPPRLIDQRIGRGAVLEEAINDAIPEALRKAFEEHDLRVLGRPEVDPKELEDGQKFSFTADVEVRPEIKLPEFSELTVEVDEVAVADEDVDAELEKLRSRFATLAGVDRPAENGDQLSLDLTATVDGEPVPDGETKGASYELGSGELIDGLDEAIQGVSAGDEKTFTTTLVGGEYAGREAEVAVVVNSVKKKELPELDDEFAQMASEFDTVAALRENVTEQLGKRKSVEQALQARDKTLETLLEAVEVPLPERVVASEVEYRQHQLSHQLDQFGLPLDRYLEMQGKSQDEFTAELQVEAEKAVRAQLLLDAIADKEELGVNQEELTGEVVRRARQNQVDPQAFADHLVESGQLTLIAADLRRGKALSLVLDHAKVSDTAGTEISAEDIRNQIPAG